MTTIKAIETLHNGHRFRSRIEARWSTFFAHMGVAYEYEPEGFTDGTTSYLPDFHITLRHHKNQTAGVWFEVKGTQPTTEELDKAKMLSMGTCKTTLIAFGSFSSGFKTVPTPVMVSVSPTGKIDGLFHWRHCPGCNVFMYARVGSSDTACVCGYPHASSLLAEAYSAARGARFGVHE